MNKSMTMDEQETIRKIAEVGELDAVMPHLPDDASVASFFEEKGFLTRRELEEYRQSLDSQIRALATLSPSARLYLSDRRTKSLIGRISSQGDADNGKAVLDMVWEAVINGFTMDENGIEAIKPYPGMLKIFKVNRPVEISYAYGEGDMNVELFPRVFCQNKGEYYTTLINNGDFLGSLYTRPQNVISLLKREILAHPKSPWKDFMNIFFDLPEIMDNYCSRVLEGKKE